MKEKNLTYEKLSKISGVSVAAMYSIIRGSRINPKIETFSKLAKALGVRTEELIADKYK